MKNEKKLDSDISIKIENLCKNYKMFARKKDRMLETMFPMVEKHGVFKAMENLNLEVKKGEVVGQKEEDKKYNGVGIASFVCGLVGIFYYQFPCGLAALITGIIGIVKFDQSKEKGKWMAITGVVLGALEILCSIILLLLGLGIFITALGTMN